MTLWIQSILFFSTNYINLSIFFFSRDIAKILKTYYFGYFGYVWPLPSKTIIPTYLRLLCLRYCKDIANFLFWELWKYFKIPIKKTASVCRSHSCLFACKNPTSSLTSFIILLLQWNSKLVFWWAVLAILTTHT